MACNTAIARLWHHLPEPSFSVFPGLHVAHYRGKIRHKKKHGGPPIPERSFEPEMTKLNIRLFNWMYMNSFWGFRNLFNFYNSPGHDSCLQFDERKDEKTMSENSKACIWINIIN